MPRYAGYHRIQAKRAANSAEENLFKAKQTPANPSLSSTSNMSTVARTTLQRAQTSPQNLTPQEVRQLQGTMGNRALSRVMAPQTSQMMPATATGPMLQRTTSTIYRRTMPKYVIQRWTPFWRKNETDQQKLERYDKTLNNINAALIVLRTGHGIAMLPLTVIDLLSNIIRPFTGNKIAPKSNEGKRARIRKKFTQVINGESLLVGKMGGVGKIGPFNLKLLKYMPWNVIPWIMGALMKWEDKINKKYVALSNRMNNIDNNQAGGNKQL